MAVQPPTGPPKPPKGDGLDYLANTLNSMKDDSEKVQILKDWIKE